MKAGANTAPGAGPCHATAGETGARFSSDLFAPVCVFCVFCVSPCCSAPPDSAPSTHDRSRHGGTASRHRRHAFHSPGEPPPPTKTPGRRASPPPSSLGTPDRNRDLLRPRQGGPLARRHGPEELKRKKRKQAQMKAGRNTTPGAGPPTSRPDRPASGFPLICLCLFAFFAFFAFRLSCSARPRRAGKVGSCQPDRGRVGGARPAERSVPRIRPAPGRSRNLKGFPP